MSSTLRLIAHSTSRLKDSSRRPCRTRGVAKDLAAVPVPHDSPSLARTNIEWVAQVSLFRPGYSGQDPFVSRKPRSQKRDLGHPLKGPAWLTPSGEKLPVRNRGDFFLVGKNCFLIGENCFLVGENFIQSGLVLQDCRLIVEQR